MNSPAQWSDRTKWVAGVGATILTGALFTLATMWMNSVHAKTDIIEQKQTIIQTEHREIERRIDERLDRFELDVADRLGRIETKVDMLLPAP